MLHLLVELRWKTFYVYEAWWFSAVDDRRKTLHVPARLSEIDVNLFITAHEKKYSFWFLLISNTPPWSAANSFLVVYRTLCLRRLRWGGLMWIIGKWIWPSKHVLYCISYCCDEFPNEVFDFEPTSFSMAFFSLLLRNAFSLWEYWSGLRELMYADRAS